MALTTTAASTSANSYADTTYARSYFELTGRKDAWDAVADVSALAQEQALYDAMLGIEAQDYVGTRSTRTQALQWPRVRNGSTWEDTTELAALKWYDLRGRQWVSNVVPASVKDAQCEQALALATNPNWLNDRYKSQTIAAGDTVLDIATPATLGKLCQAAMLKLDGLLLTGGSVRRLMRS
jgi:hypothetical protein